MGRGGRGGEGRSTIGRENEKEEKKKKGDGRYRGEVMEAWCELSSISGWRAELVCTAFIDKS